MLANQMTWRELMARKMPAKVAYALAKNIRKIDTELELYSSTRTKLLGDNWKKTEDGTKYDIPPEDEAKWQEMHKELLETEVTLDLHTIDFPQIENLEFTPAEMLALDFMITQEQK